MAMSQGKTFQLDIQILLGGGDEANMATQQDMDSKCLMFEDILPIVPKIIDLGKQSIVNKFICIIA